MPTDIGIGASLSPLPKIVTVRPPQSTAGYLSMTHSESWQAVKSAKRTIL